MRLKVTSLPKRKQKFRHIVFSIEMRFQQLVIKSGCQSLERVQVSESPAFCAVTKLIMISVGFQQLCPRVSTEALGNCN